MARNQASVPVPNDNTPKLLGINFDPSVQRKRTVTFDVETEYPDALNVGDTIHTLSGFMIGTITDVVR